MLKVCLPALPRGSRAWTRTACSPPSSGTSSGPGGIWGTGPRCTWCLTRWWPCCLYPSFVHKGPADPDINFCLSKAFECLYLTLMTVTRNLFSSSSCMDPEMEPMAQQSVLRFFQLHSLPFTYKISFWELVNGKKSPTQSKKTYSISSISRYGTSI